MIDVEVLVESKVWNKIIENPQKLIKNSLKKFPKSYSFANKKVLISVLLTSNQKIRILLYKVLLDNFLKSLNLLKTVFFSELVLISNSKFQKLSLLL